MGLGSACAPARRWMKRLASRLTWWHTMPHKSTPRSTPQRGEASRLHHIFAPCWSLRSWPSSGQRVRDDGIASLHTSRGVARWPPRIA